MKAITRKAVVRRLVSDRRAAKNIRALMPATGLSFAGSMLDHGIDIMCDALGCSRQTAIEAYPVPMQVIPAIDLELNVRRAWVISPARLPGFERTPREVRASMRECALITSGDKKAIARMRAT